VPADLQSRAYENRALPIGYEQTISQPLVVARMLELLRLRGDELVLDIGTGSGYHAALLARLAAHVISVERHSELSAEAGRTLRLLEIENVELIVGDGSGGLPDRAPFDAISVAAAIPGLVPRTFVDQLGPGGRLIAPVALDPSRPDEQRLIVLQRQGDRVAGRRFEQVRFVPLLPGLPD
jgi:protein-L-isoaspartate(D-aspartate) O-methyltransferase